MSSRARRRQAVAVVQGLTAKRGRRSAADPRLFDELENLAHLIETAKRDIAALSPDDIRQKHLPTATDELDAIVSATAEATSAILDAAEHLSTIAAASEAATGNQITEQVTRIFEACTFQDITGQRITKVVKALKQIEVKVTELVHVFGAATNQKAAAAPEPAATGDAALLNGPQLAKDAVSQSEIDTFFDKK